MSIQKQTLKEITHWEVAKSCESFKEQKNTFKCLNLHTKCTFDCEDYKRKC